MKIRIIFAIISHILAIVYSVSPDLSVQPAPKCQTGFFYKTLPLIADQSYITNLDHLFNGYNLQYKLQEHQDFKDYITLGDKMIMQGKQIPDSPLIGLKNYHIDKKGNGWGNNFIALTQRSQRTFVSYGVLNNNKSAPVVNNQISVENNTNTTCFDAIQFKQQNLILVDCVVKLPKPNARGQILQNLFYYFKISDGSFIKTVKTQLYVNYRNVGRRSLLLYSDLGNFIFNKGNSHTFLLRSYFYNDIEKPLNQNTYIEVFMITDPNDPWIVQIIDRSFLNTKALSITDVRIYLGQIFILDQKMGIYRVFINSEEDLKFNGFYQVKGFQRFSVFSSNLQDNFQLALANAHSALQIDWTNKNQPRLINKYSLMPDSKVSQVFLNQRFIFIQSLSSAQGKTYNYTWIMNRGDRTYTKAFKVIKHNSAKTIIDLNQDMSFLIVIDDQKLANYAIDDTNMVLKISKNEQLINKVNKFKITATSKDEMDPKTIKKCQIYINFTLLDDNNKTMWPIGQLPPNQFTANYPGKVQIKLHQYVFGPNITYKLRQADHDVIKKLKVYQQEQLSINWGIAPPNVNNLAIKFLLSETVNYQSLPYDLMHLYLQDDTNQVYFIQCYPDHLKQNVTCNFTHLQQFEGEINYWESGFFVNSNTFEQNHIIAYTTKKYNNKVRVVDFTKKQSTQIIQDILLQKGFAGNATSIGITNKQLYVVLKYVKKIQIYDLQLCLDGICEPKCQLNHMKMYQLGIKYFSPIQVKTSLYHPNIIFIKTSDQLIVVDYNAQCRPKLLAIINPVQTAQNDFNFKLNQGFLIITIQSLNLIKQYNLQRLKLGDIRFTKQYPKYGYSLPKDGVLDVSDKGNCIYQTMVNQQGDHQVFVYRSGYPAVGSLYDVIDLTSSDPVLVDTTGYQIDYVSVFANKQLHIFRQYEKPLAEVFNPNISYSFYLDYSNPSSRSNLEQIDVKIINLPTYIKVNPWLNDIMNTKDLLYSGPNKVNQINDSKWWQGNVLVVEADCQDCKGDDPIIKVMNHIQHQEQLTLVPAMSEYQWTLNGGSIQAMNSIINVKSNGTVNQFVKLPFTQNSVCITQAIGHRLDYQVSGCLSDGTVNLYLTSFVSQKGFPFQPFQTTAINLFKLQAVNDLIILVDTDNDAYHKSRPGGIYLFGVNLDDQIPTSILQVQYINGDDIGMDELGDLYINNAQLTYHPVTQTYRLYFTQVTRGIFTIQFKYNDKSSTIAIKAINWLKIEPLLTKLGYQLPYDASYQAVTKMTSSYDQTLKKITDKILLTTGKFHTIQLSIDFGVIDGNLQDIKITRLYMRYSFYDIQNYIKYHNNLFVISQILPNQFDIQNRSKQILTTYSTSLNRSFTDDPQDDYPIDDKKIDDNKTIEERGFLGGFRINDTVLHYYDFNLTYEDDGHSQPRVGMVLIQYLSNKIQKFTLHQNLSVVTKDLVDTQIIYIDLKNDFSLQKIRILINGKSPFPQWKLIAIILFSIIGGILLLAGIIFGLMKLKNKYYGSGQSQDMMQDSLLTGGSDRKSFEPLTLRQSQDMSQSKQSKKQQKKRLKQQQKQQKRKQKQQKQRQKQRLKQEKQRLKQQKQRQRQQRQRQKQSQRQKNRINQRQRQSERQSQRQRERERQRERQQQRQNQRERQRLRQRQRQPQPINSASRFDNRPTFNQNNSYSQNRVQEDQSNSYSRFGQRRAFRQRPQRPSRNNQDNQAPRQPPPRRRNIAIIED